MKYVYWLLCVFVIITACKPLYVNQLPPPPVASPEQQAQLIENIIAEQYSDEKPAAILIEFLDYQCPYCQQMFSIIREAEREFGTKLGVITQHYPLDRQCNPYLGQQIHPFACGAAVAAECAREQGQFSLYQTTLFVSKKLDKKSLLNHAETLGLDMNKFETCLSSQAPLNLIGLHLERGGRLGIEGTPTFILNGQKISPRSLAELNAAIRDVLTNSS